MFYKTTKRKNERRRGGGGRKDLCKNNACNNKDGYGGKHDESSFPMYVETNGERSDEICGDKNRHWKVVGDALVDAVRMTEIVIDFTRCTASHSLV